MSFMAFKKTTVQFLGFMTILSTDNANFCPASDAYKCASTKPSNDGSPPTRRTSYQQGE